MPSREQIGYGQVQTTNGWFVDGALSSATSTASAVVKDYNNISLQALITGSSSAAGNSTSSFTIESSLDGFNWEPELVWSGFATATALTSSLHFLSQGRRGHLRAMYSGSGDNTASLYMVAGA